MKADILIIGRVRDEAGQSRLALAHITGVELRWCRMEPGIPLACETPHRVEEISFYMADGSLYRQATWPLDPEYFDGEQVVATSAPAIPAEATPDKEGKKAWLPLLKTLCSRLASAVTGC